MTDLDEEILIRRFLLGELSQDERERVEERLLADEDFLTQVDGVEDELIDDYARGKLRAPERERFERYFLITNERQERLEFAPAFHQVLSESYPHAAQESPDEQFWGTTSGLWAWMLGRRALAFGAVAVVMLLIVSVATFLWRGLLSRSQQEQATYTTQQPSKSNPQNEKVQGVEGNNERENQNAVPIAKDKQHNEQNLNQATTNAVVKNTARAQQKPQAERNQASLSFSIALVSGAVRGEGEGVKQFAVPKYTKAVRLELVLDEADAQPLTSYEAELQSGDAQTLYRAGDLRALSNRKGGRSVTFKVPKTSLLAGDYQVVLRERGAGGSAGETTRYYFRVRDASLQQKPN